ncbi:MAG TPA: dihydrolipoamide acetyltransferase family protein, partial [Anaerolineales bacterium]
MAKDVIMPALGMAQETGTLIQWLKSAGDSVTKGEPLMEIETDKATVEIEAPASGILSNVTAQAGDVIPVGQRIALILAPGEVDSKTPLQPKPEPVSSPKTDSSSPSVTATPVAARLAAEHNLDISQIKPQGGQIRKEDVLAYLDTQNKPVTSTRILASPKARRLAQERGIDLRQVRGTGPDGAILVSNLPVSSPSLTRNEGATLAVSHIWRVMVDRLSQAWTTIPHFYLMREVNASRLVAWREKIKNNSAEKITYTDLLVRLTAAALRRYPRLNASWQNENIALNSEINIGLAVAVDDG